jgi:hypothetical protein
MSTRAKAHAMTHVITSLKGEGRLQDLARV